MTSFCHSFDATCVLVAQCLRVCCLQNRKISPCGADFFLGCHRLRWRPLTHLQKRLYPVPKRGPTGSRHTGVRYICGKTQTSNKQYPVCVLFVPSHQPRTRHQWSSKNTIYTALLRWPSQLACMHDIYTRHRSATVGRQSSEVL